MRLMTTIIPKNGIKLFVFGIESILQIIAVTLQNNSEINCRFFALIFFQRSFKYSRSGIFTQLLPIAEFSFI